MDIWFPDRRFFLCSTFDFLNRTATCSYCLHLEVFISRLASRRPYFLLLPCVLKLLMCARNCLRFLSPSGFLKSAVFRDGFLLIIGFLLSICREVWPWPSLTGWRWNRSVREPNLRFQQGRRWRTLIDATHIKRSHIKFDVDRST